MPEQGSKLLGAVVAWCERNGTRLAGLGVEVGFVGPSTGRNKNSVTVEIVAPDRLVGVTIWDSGECEVITALVSGQDDLLVAVNELTEAAAGVALLDRIVADLIKHA